MKWEATITSPKSIHGIIQRDSKAGFYLYIYEDGKDVFDDLQDHLDVAQEVAFEKFGVPTSAWKQVP